MTNPDALEIAAALDRERREQGPRGSLHGVPILLKDNIGSGDRMVTSAGSLALASPVADDAFLTANFRSTRSSSGWSGVGGQTRNPHVLDRNPCGSSAGSGAAVAAGLCTAAIGTETDGSIVCPANANGIVGIKPTLGLVSRSGIVPLAHSQDTAGPMARSVIDAAAVLSALVGSDPSDATTTVAPQHQQQDYTSFCTAAGLDGLRLGVARNYTGFHETADQLLAEALAALGELGATLVDPAEVPHKGDYDDAEVRGTALRVQGRPQRLPDRASRATRAQPGWSRGH